MFRFGSWNFIVSIIFVGYIEFFCSVVGGFSFYFFLLLFLVRVAFHLLCVVFISIRFFFGIYAMNHPKSPQSCLSLHLYVRLALLQICVPVFIRRCCCLRLFECSIIHIVCLWGFCTNAEHSTKSKNSYCCFVNTRV